MTFKSVLCRWVYCSVSLSQRVQEIRGSFLYLFGAGRVVCPFVGRFPHVLSVQWKPSKPDTIGECNFVLYREVSLTQGLFCMCVYVNGTTDSILYTEVSFKRCSIVLQLTSYCLSEIRLTMLLPTVEFDTMAAKIKSLCSLLTFHLSITN